MTIKKKKSKLYYCKDEKRFFTCIKEDDISVYSKNYVYIKESHLDHSKFFNDFDMMWEGFIFGATIYEKTMQDIVELIEQGFDFKKENVFK
jgi:hypothetical protein